MDSRQQHIKTAKAHYLWFYDIGLYFRTLWQLHFINTIYYVKLYAHDDVYARCYVLKLL